MLRDHFCSSPWFHVRINPNGDYVPCRWDYSLKKSGRNIQDTGLLEYINSEEMCELRNSLLEGKEVFTYQSCHYEDRQNKVSGRQRQLLKSAIDIGNFDKTFCSSPHYEMFKHSYEHRGKTNKLPVDLQIDLGNTCNSACIMCHPMFSSRLQDEYVKLNGIEPNLFFVPAQSQNWADNPVLLEKFINDLEKIPDLKYLHFLGGETLYLKSFYSICEKLIERGIAKNVSIGTTTNGTVYTPKLEKILTEFKHVHLGLSVESMQNVNDYVRWPSKISDVRSNMQNFLSLRDRYNIQISLRITPTIFTVYHLDTIFKYMIENNVIAESCNILQDPRSLRVELLPDDLRQTVLEKINKVINQYNLVDPYQPIVNRRRDDLIQPVISQIVFEYRNFLESYQTPATATADREELVKFIRAFEKLRGNSILDYLPEYEKFLRIHGY